MATDTSSASTCSTSAAHRTALLEAGWEPVMDTNDVIGFPWTS